MSQLAYHGQIVYTLNAQASVKITDLLAVPYPRASYVVIHGYYPFVVFTHYSDVSTANLSTWQAVQDWDGSPADNTIGNPSLSQSVTLVVKVYG